MVQYSDRISSDPEVMLGKPVVRGTRITVESILRHLGDGDTIDQIIRAWPNLEKEDILAALSFSADVIAHEDVTATRATNRSTAAGDRRRTKVM